MMNSITAQFIVHIRAIRCDGRVILVLLCSCAIYHLLRSISLCWFLFYYISFFFFCTTMIPQSVIDDDNDHVMHYAQSLPYAKLLDKEAEIWLTDICTHLVTSVRAKDFTGGALASVRRLSRYFLN